MFDIVAFKTLREKIGTSGLYQQFQRGILPGITHAAARQGKSVKALDGRNIYVPNFTQRSVSFRFISDTVIFFTRDDSSESFFAIVHSSFSLLQFGISGGKAPYRGAIGWGDLIAVENVIVGSAIEDAHAGESLQLWAGGMLTEACTNFITSRHYIEEQRRTFIQIAENGVDERLKRAARENSRWLVKYAIPTQENPKDGPAVYSRQDAYAIDWTIRMYEGAATQAFHPSDSRHAQEIAANTLAFEQWARANNR